MQQTLEEALARLTGETTGVVGSSRTDAGVHACVGLCAHFDRATRIPPKKPCFALNTMLPGYPRPRKHARAGRDSTRGFSACGKVYRYTFCNARHACAIGSSQFKAHVPMPMDVERMHEEAQSSAVGTISPRLPPARRQSTVRTINRAQVERQGEDVVLTVLGDGFLYNMVRIIAGTLMEVGTGTRAGCIARAIATGDRLLLGQTAPACGLTLMRVLYDGDEEKRWGILRKDRQELSG